MLEGFNLLSNKLILWLIIFLTKINLKSIKHFLSLEFKYLIKSFNVLDIVINLEMDVILNKQKIVK